MTVNDDPKPEPILSDPFEAMLGFQLRRTSVAVMGKLTAELEPLGILPSEASLLMLIGANPGVTQSDIARALRAQPANLVPLLTKLSRRKLLDRAPAKGRAVALSLSEQGGVLYAGVREAFARHDARITRSIPDGQKAQVIAMLRQIVIDACCADGMPAT